MQTFRKHVLEFWDWFPGVAQRYAALLKNDDGQQVVSEVNVEIGRILPNLSWAFGNEDKGHSFTLTGEGQIAKQLLTEFWLSQAVKVPNWIFYASRQPSPPDSVSNMSIGLGEEQHVDAESFLIRTVVDEEAERIDITAWHPAYENVGEEHHMPILFIFLDEALGEFGTQTNIGEISVEPVTPGNDTRPLVDLPKFIESVREYHDWEKLTPLESYSAYEIKKPTDGPRGDTLFGTTCIPDLIFEFIDNDGRLSDNPLAETGAGFVYVAVDGSVFPDGSQVDVRSKIEDAIDVALRKQASGRSLGGAFGIRQSYIEFLIFDDDNSRDIIRQTLQQLDLDELSSLEEFS
jgi:hypothetical protein